jgi:hypothetical protein
VTALREIAAGHVKFEQELRNVLGHHAPLPAGGTPAPTLETVAEALRRQPFIPTGR